jgi:hypothetical protein
MDINISKNWREPKYILGLISILVLGAVIIISIIRDRIVNPPQWQISVAGQGKVAYQPDTANISLGVKVDKQAKAEDALKQLNDKMNKILAAIKQAGVAAEDIQTQNYSLSPRYDIVDAISKLTGYDANQTVEIKIHNLQNNNGLITKVIEAAGKTGTNQIDGISFEYADMNKLKQEARLKAIADARAKSKEISQALGVKLCKIVGWWENIVSPVDSQISYKGDVGGLGGGGGASSPVVPSGTQELVIEVNVNYQIK